MPATLTPFDQAIKTAKLTVKIKTPAGGARDILFQFPPRVVNDSRGGDWEEKPAGANSGDMIAIYKSAKPRLITLQWKYIVGFAGWSIDQIKAEVQTLRGYFRNPFIEGGGGPSPMVIELLLWKIGGNDTMSFRMKDANIKHGDTLVGSPNGDVFPLTTEVSIELQSWPLLGNPPAQMVPGQKVFGPDWF